jgi:hypothetical protein
VIEKLLGAHLKMNYLKQLALSVCLTSTLLLWGLVLGFNDTEIMIAALAVGIIQWALFMESKNG